MRRFLLLASFFVSALASSFCQTQTPQTGIYEFGPYDSPGIDTINRGNLNIHLTIPIFSKPGRGGSNFSFALNYDGLVWSPTSSSGLATWSPAANWGWTTVSNAEFGYISYNLEQDSCSIGSNDNYNIYYFTKFVYHDSAQRSHPFNFSYHTKCDGSGDFPGSGTYTTLDNSGYTIYRNGDSFTAFTKAGEQYAVQSVAGFNGLPPTAPSSAGVYTDTNGNQISASYNSSTSTTTYTDTLGNAVLTVTGSGTSSSPVVYTYKDTNGTAQSITVKYTNYSIATSFGVSGVGEYTATSVPLVSSISYPDPNGNNQYNFTYEPTTQGGSTYTGRLAKVTLPTGGAIIYTYSGIEADGSPSGLTRATSDGSTSYSRSGVSSTAPTTNYTDAAGNVTQSTFLEDTQGYIYETSRSSYAGGISGTPLQQLITCYAQTVDCTTNSVTAPIGYVSTRLYNNGISVQTDQRQYSGGFLLDDNDSIIDVATAYQSFTGVNGIGFARVSSVTTTDKASSLQIAETSYLYDQGSLASFSGSPQPVSETSARGNVTNINPWLNTSNGTFGATTIVYDITGTPQNSTNPNGQTTYGHDPTGSFVNLLTPPTPSSNVSLPINGTYDTAYTGLPSTVTDPNGAQIVYKSYDPLLRPKEIDAKDSGGHVVGETTFSYISPNQVGIQNYQSATVNGDTETLYDGYGRLSRVAIYNGQSTSPWYQQDSCYDANGRLAFESYRYQGNGFVGQAIVCSGAGDAYTYDAAGRVHQIAHGDGSGTNITYQYSGAATEITDENGHSRISQVDGHGRITSICEVSTKNQQSDSPVSCGTAFPGVTGYMTNYSYTVDSSKDVVTTVSQGLQTRTFVTDSLGRTVSVTEPERGVTSYTYAYTSGTGLQVTRKRPKANPGNAGQTTTTTTQYDALGRVVSVNYDDSLTPNKQYVYDTNPGWPDTVSNVKGRLVAMGAELSSGASHTGSLFNYDALGRVVDQWECGPNTCPNYGTASHLLAYAYDWTGNLTAIADPASGQIGYSRSVAGEVTGMTNNSWQLNGNHGTSSLVSSVVNGPNGPVSYNLGNGLSVSNRYDTQGRLNGGWVCSGSTVNYCTGGTQRYGYTINTRIGPNVVGLTDTVVNKGMNYGYDDFNRLNSLTVTVGTVQNYTYSYDRYGNRLSQTVTQGSGYNFSAGYNPATNQINSGGYAYDAAGNMTNDGFNSYTYDAEGNVLTVSGNATASYVYDAMNHRSWVQTGGATTEYAFDSNGRRISSWIEPSNIGNEGRIYWDGQPFAYRSSDATTYFQHEDYLGTERLRTSDTGAVAASFTSLPWGDGYAGNIIDPAAGQETFQFAGIDQDISSAYPISDHAQFRQYSYIQGRWFSPDPYDGSYDITNPQSLNRYAYVLNNPLSFTDPLGLDCNDDTGTDDGSFIDGNGNLNTVVGGGCQAPLGCSFIFNPQGQYEGTSCTGGINVSGTQTNPGNPGGNSGGGSSGPNSGCSSTPGLGVNGGGVILNAEGTLGLSKLGGTAQGTAGFGFFGGKPGGFLSYVATAVAGGSSVGAPAQQGELNGGQNPIVVGAYGGIGGGAIITNATSVQQLSGTSQQYTLSLPFVSLSFSYGGGIWTASASVGPAPITGKLFAAHTSTTTNTVVKGPC